jgi:hypothetical protein
LFWNGQLLLRPGRAPPRATLNALHEELENTGVVRVTVVLTHSSVDGV